MKIFTAAQIKQCDNYTIQQEHITSAALMDRAARACCSWLKSRFDTGQAFLVICGMGNNGGDGLALTRMLLQEGFSARALVLKHARQFSADTSENLKLLHALASDNVSILEEGLMIADIPPGIVIIDAIFGTGLNRAINGWVAGFIGEINLLPNLRIAIDMPSGLPADMLPGKEAVIMRADHTLSFQFYKRSFLHPETEPYVGMIAVLDIGLSRDFIRDNHSRFHITDIPKIRSLYKPRKAFDHKGSYGTAVLAGGSYGKIGAIALSGYGALRAGAGKVFIHAPACGYEVLQTLVPEAMVVTTGSRYTEEMIFPDHTQAGIGPGLGLEPVTRKSFALFLEQYMQPLVLDADALNIISGAPSLLHQIPPGSVLTPHPKEFERLFGKSVNSMEQVELARNQAMKYNIIIVLKGHHTVVITNDGECWYNATGNPGMATAGSGDVLTGVITGLMAQGYASAEAAILGVYLHGLAGDLAAKEISQEALLARDIARYIGKGFLALDAQMA